MAEYILSDNAETIDATLTRAKEGGAIDQAIDDISPVILDTRVTTYTKDLLFACIDSGRPLYIRESSARYYPVLLSVKQGKSIATFFYMIVNSREIKTASFDFSDSAWTVYAYRTLATLDSPTFTGTPTAPEPTETSGSTQIATKGYVDNAAAGSNKVLTFKNVQVVFTSAGSEPTESNYPDYPYQIGIPLTDVTADYSPDVRFSPEDVTADFYTSRISRHVPWPNIFSISVL